MADYGETLWRFSLAFYAYPRVAEALLALQDRQGLDVNLVLFALWHGATGRGRLGRDGLAAAERASRTVRVEFVQPLRALRRKFRHDPDEEVQRLRQGLKALELSAEELAQSQLARTAAPPDASILPQARLAAAEANLAVYLGPRIASGAEAGDIREALAAFARDRLVTPRRCAALNGGGGRQ